ncbi:MULTISPECIES: guanine deaminase [unclassified Rathayibacter]|uniref:guanine deaminase n=1 Tax=unclassified Rathayibacter TaxID=2609250 RepID=UPI0006F34324|nr:MULTISPECIES: guanine deaminase [unclassified Rathayibacter]KQQ06058.1 guanine deaminase [Rathayibacter sp. Leaf294]KQS13915.1 guanine deaminase [Rathayibacter sp. Leaf185]
MALTAIRGTFLDFIDDPWKHVGDEEAATRFHADGLLVLEDGIIVDFGPYAELASKHSGVPVTEIPDRIIVPGFIDGHIHLPQTRVLGAYGEQLLPWLQKWVFPEEHKYADRDYALEGTTHFFDNLLASGTTTAQTFTTGSLTCNEVFFEEAAKRNMRMIGGLTGIDRHVPDYFANTPEQFYADSTALIEKHHRVGRSLYAVTPRFGFGASEELLDACRRLKEEHPDVWINTHISENPAEIHGVLALHEDCHDYLAVYEKYDLVGPKFTGGHGVWLSNDEFRRFSQSGASVAFCPSSNLYLGSGLFRLGRATDPEHRVLLSLGTDMGGGNRFSLLNSLEDAYKVGMLNNTILDGSIVPSEMDLAESERNKLSPYRAFYSVTKGGAEALYIDDLVGSFDIGKEADFVALDWTAGPPASAWHQSLAHDGGELTQDAVRELLFGIMMVGDERAVDQTWVMGELAYQKA